MISTIDDFRMMSNQKSLRVLHVAETLPGGPASYLNEILPYQLDLFGRENVAVVVPEQQKDHLKGFAGRTFYFDRKSRGLRSLLNLEKAIIGALNSDWDIIHLHSTFAGAVTRVSPRINSKTKSLKAKIVYCAHCWAFDRPVMGVKEKIFAAIELYLTKYTTAIVNISPHEREMLENMGFPSEKIFEVISGITDCSPPQRSGLINNNPLRLLYVGRFDKQKGLDLLIRRLSETQCPVELTVIGAAVLNERVNFAFPSGSNLLGWVPRAQIPEIMSNSDFLLMPSRWEGMPLVALEALCCGLPIIGNSIPPIKSLRDLARDYPSNPVLAVDFESAGVLDDILSQFYLNKSTLSDLSRSARELYERNFSALQMNRALVGMYSEIF